MNLGTPDIFNPSDSPERLSAKLNNTFESIWRALKVFDVNLQVDTNTDVYGHTSVMPDSGAVNPDHDKRYYIKSQTTKLFAPISSVHDPVTVSDTATIDLTLTGQLISGATIAAGIFAQILTVDGSGSLLDSDFLDGQHGSYYAPAAAISGTQYRIPRFATTSTLGDSPFLCAADNSTVGLLNDIKLTFGTDIDSSIMDNGTNMVFTRESAGNFVFTGGNVGIGVVPTAVGTYGVLAINGTGTSGGYVSLRCADVEQGNIYSNSSGLALSSIGATNIEFWTNSVKCASFDSAGVFRALKSISAKGVISSGNSAGRGDAQIEFVNDGTGHAMLASALLQNPGNTTDENAWSGQGYGASGSFAQMGAFYMRWQDTNETNGYSVLGVHPNYWVAGTSTADVAFEVYGAHGIGMFLGAAATPPTDRYLMIKRTSGRPSIVGTADLVLDSNYGGAANTVFLNAYNAGNVWACLGGGNMSVGGSAASYKLDVFGTGRFAGAQGAPLNTGSTQTNLGLRVWSDATNDVSIDFGCSYGGSSSLYGWMQVYNPADLSVEYPLSINPFGGSVAIGMGTALYDHSDLSLVCSKSIGAGDLSGYVAGGDAPPALLFARKADSGTTNCVYMLDLEHYSDSGSVDYLGVGMRFKTRPNYNYGNTPHYAGYIQLWDYLDGALFEFHTYNYSADGIYRSMSIGHSNYYDAVNLIIDGAAHSDQTMLTFNSDGLVERMYCGDYGAGDGLYIGIEGTSVFIGDATNYAKFLSGKMTTTGRINCGTMTEYADNAAAVAGGLGIGDFYRTGDLVKVVHA